MVALLWGRIYYTVVFPLIGYTCTYKTTTLYSYRHFKQTSTLWWSLKTMVLLRNNFHCDQSNVHRWSLCIYLVNCSIVNQFWNKNRLIPVFFSGTILCMHILFAFMSIYATFILFFLNRRVSSIKTALSCKLWRSAESNLYTEPVVSAEEDSHYLTVVGQRQPKND